MKINHLQIYQMLTTDQTTQLNHFRAAKEIALSIEKGTARRARYNGMLTNYMGFHDSNGRFWVIGDTLADLPNPDAQINGKPAREIFGDFSIIYK